MVDFRKASYASRTWEVKAKVRIMKGLVVTGTGRVHWRAQRDIIKCITQKCQVGSSVGDLVYKCLFLIDFKAKETSYIQNFRMLRIWNLLSYIIVNIDFSVLEERHFHSISSMKFLLTFGCLWKLVYCTLSFYLTLSY